MRGWWCPWHVPWMQALFHQPLPCSQARAEAFCLTNACNSSFGLQVSCMAVLCMLAGMLTLGAWETREKNQRKRQEWKEDSWSGILVNTCTMYARQDYMGSSPFLPSLSSDSSSMVSSRCVIKIILSLQSHSQLSKCVQTHFETSLALRTFKYTQIHAWLLIRVGACRHIFPVLMLANE